MHALDTMRALASKAEVIHLSQGDVLFRTGETGTCMYGLLEGSVRPPGSIQQAMRDMRTSLWVMCLAQGPW